MMATLCIHEANPTGGFVSDHTRLCARECGDAATVHARVGGWCGNVCPRCGKALAEDKAHKGAVTVIDELRGLAVAA